MCYDQLPSSTEGDESRGAGVSSLGQENGEQLGQYRDQLVESERTAQVAFDRTVLALSVVPLVFH